MTFFTTFNNFKTSKGFFDKIQILKEHNILNNALPPSEKVVSSVLQLMTKNFKSSLVFLRYDILHYW